MVREDLGTLFHPGVARVGVRHLFLPMQKLMRLAEVRHVGDRAGDAMHQARGGIRANVRLHPEMPLVALLGLVPLRVALAFTVLGRAGRGDEGGIHPRASAAAGPVR